MNVGLRVAIVVPLVAALQVVVWAGEQTAKPATAKTLRLPTPPFHYANQELPRHCQAAAARRFDNTPPDNPVTDAGATLGRVLFYDTRLSANDTVSCSTCHVQKHAFDDPSRFSRGFKGGRTDRHAMNLVNLRFHPRSRPRSRDIRRA